MRPRLVELLLFALQAALSLGYRFGAGVRMQCGERWAHWDWFWQSLRMDDLRADLAGSLWHLHSQPPVFNLLGGVLGKVFGDAHLEALEWVYRGLAAACVVLGYRIARNVTARPRLALATGLVLAVHPGLVVYACYPMYTLPCAFLALLAVERLSVRTTTATGDATPPAPVCIGAVAAVVALVLLRSAFHIALLVPVVGLAALAARRRARTFAVAALLVCAPALGWYAKNAAVFGFFGASSWSGFGLYRVASHGRPRERIAELGPMFAELPAYEPPSRYERYGFVQRSDVPALAHDDFNNVNVPAIASAYGAAARTLIADDPLHYARNVAKSYEWFCGPSTRYKHTTPLALRMGGLESAYVAVITLGGGLAQQGSLWYVLLPGSLLLHVLAAAAEAGRRAAAWREHVRVHAAAWLAALLLGYTTLVSCCFELGENERFKFMIEPLAVVFLALVADATVRVLRARRARAAAPV